MNTPKLIKISQDFLDGTKGKQRKRNHCLKEIQKKLKARSKKIKRKIKSRNMTAAALKTAKKELAIVKAQRKKVILALKAPEVSD